MPVFASGRYEETDRGMAYITDETKKIPHLTSNDISLYNAEGTWHEDVNGWWFEYSGGGYPSNTWEEINSYRYYFNESGYMITGWIQVNEFWYFCETSDQVEAPHGSMITGWREVNDEWYFFETAGTDERPLGAMITGWHTWSGNEYYFREEAEGSYPEGSMATGLYYDDNEFGYYFNSKTGAMEQKFLTVTRYAQEKDMWCWNASAEMIGKFVNPDSTKTQTEVADEVSPIFPPDTGKTIQTAARAIEIYGEGKIKNAFVYGSPLEFEKTKENIDNKCPIYAQISWDLLTGHAEVISGYTINDKKIKMIDPWENNPTVYVPYDEAIDEYTFEAGRGTYTNSAYITR